MKVQEWLKNGSRTPFIRDGLLFVIVPKDDRFNFLYLQKRYRDEDVELEPENLKFVGVYDKVENISYLTDSYTKYSNPLSPLDGISLTVLRTKMIEEIKNKIQEMIESNFSQFDTQSSDIQEKVKSSHWHIESEARAAFLYGKFPDLKSWLEYKHVENEEWTSKNLLSYIEDSEATCTEKAQAWIIKYYDDICFQLATLQEIKKAYDNLTATPSKLHTIRNIIQAMSSFPDAKTVTVYLLKKETEFTGKINAYYFRRDPISTYDNYGFSAPDRRRYIELFGQYDDFDPDEIEKITYGKKVIYQKKKEQESNA